MATVSRSWSPEFDVVLDSPLRANASGLSRKRLLETALQQSAAGVSTDI